MVGRRAPPGTWRRGGVSVNNNPRELFTEGLRWSAGTFTTGPHIFLRLVRKVCFVSYFKLERGRRGRGEAQKGGGGEDPTAPLCSHLAAARSSGSSLLPPPASSSSSRIAIWIGNPNARPHASSRARVAPNLGSCFAVIQIPGSDLNFGICRDRGAGELWRGRSKFVSLVSLESLDFGICGGSLFGVFCFFFVLCFFFNIGGDGQFCAEF